MAQFEIGANTTWANEPMWDREKVIEAHKSGNGASQEDAEDLLHKCGKKILATPSAMKAAC